MPGKRVQFDDETWHALDRLAKDRMQPGTAARTSNSEAPLRRVTFCQRSSQREPCKVSQKPNAQSVRTLTHVRNRLNIDVLELH
jgi:hypothetical protein